MGLHTDPKKTSYDFYIYILARARGTCRVARQRGTSKARGPARVPDGSLLFFSKRQRRHGDGAGRRVGPATGSSAMRKRATIPG